MSTSVDQRVVEMRFDNAQFEDGVKTSISTLDRLKSALNLNGAGKGLQEIQQSANTISFSGLSTAVDEVSTKFSALETIATGALLGIGNKIAMTGEKLLKSLSVDNISAGWGKFEKKTGSVATLVAQGNALETVSAELNRLNWFTDETSYNFTDMVDNIAKFTASGKSLSESVDAMMGIANWAALSGQNARKASMAMYQLSQAMSKGVLKYDDWKSVQNAGMDNIEFRKKAVETALSSEIATLKEVNGGYETLNGKVFTLAELFTSDAMSRTGWLNADVMMGTFNKYSAAVNKIYEEQKRLQDEEGIYVSTSKVIEMMGGTIDGFGLKAFKAAQEARSFTDVIDSVQDAVSTGWMKTFEYIFGDYEEATKLWTAMANELWEVFAGSGEIRNLALEEWKKNVEGGRDVLVDSFKTLYYDIKTVTAPITEAFNNVFNIDDEVAGGSLNSKIAAILIKITAGFKDFADSLTITEDAFDKLTVIFEGAWKVVQLLAKGFKTVFDIIKPLTQPIIALGGVLLDLGVYISNLVTRFTDWINTSEEVAGFIDIVKNSVQTFSDGLTLAINNLSAYYEVFELIAEILGDYVVAAFEDLRYNLDLLLAPVKEFINLRFGDAFERLGNALLKFDLSTIVTTVGEIVQKFKQFPIINDILNGLRTALIGIVAVVLTVGSSIYGFVNDVITAFTSGGFLGVFDLFYEKIKNAASALWDLLSDNFITRKIAEIKNAVMGLFTGESVSERLEGIRNTIRELISNSGLGQWFQNLKNIVTGLVGPLGAIGEGILNFVQNLTPARIAVLAFAGAILGLIINCSRMFGAFRELAGGATDFLTVLSGGKVGKPNTIREVAIAIGVLAASLAVLAAIPAEDLKNATDALLKLAGAMVVIEVLGIVADKLKKNDLGGGLKDAATSILMLAGAVAILVGAFKILETVNLIGVGERLLVLGAIMGTLAFIAGLMGKYAAPLTSGGLTLIAFAGATYILAAALEKLNELDVDELKPKVLALVEVMGALALLSYGVGHIGVFSAVGLIAVVWALKAVLPTLEELAGVKYDNLKNVIEGNIDLIRKLGTVAMLIALVESITGNGMKAFGIGLIAMAGSLLLLTQVVKVLAEMNPGDVRNGMSFISQCIGMFALLELLSGLTKSNRFISFAIGLIPLTGAVALLGLMVEYLGSIDQNVLRKGTSALWSIVGMVAVLELVSKFASQGHLGGVISLLIGIAGVAAELIWLSNIPWDQLKNGVLAFAIVLGTLTVALAVTSGLKGTSFGTIVETIALIVGAVLALEYLQQFDWKNLIGAAVSMGILFSTLAVVTAVAAGLGVTGMAGIMAAGSGIVQLGVVLLGILGICEILNEINTEFPGSVIDASLDMLINLGTKLGLAIGGFIGGLTAGAMSGLPLIGTSLSQFAENSKGFMDLMANGSFESAARGVNALADTFLTLAERDFINRLTTWFGGSTTSIDEFGEQLVSFGEAMADYANAVSGVNMAAVEPSAKAAEMLVNLANTLPNTGGVVGWFAGENDWGTFSAGLVGFGEAMRDYAGIVTEANLDENTFTKSNAAAMTLVALQNTFGNHGGLVAALFGDNDWASFSDGLVDFGTAIVKYAQTISQADLSETTFEASNKAISMLVELEKTFKTTGGFSELIFGGGSWDTFKDGLVGFGKALVKYSQTVAGDSLDSDAIGKSIPAARALVRLADELPDDFDGVFSGLFGGKQWNSIGLDLPYFGKMLKGYSDSLGEGGINADAITNSAVGAGALVELSHTIPSDFGGWIQKVFGGSSWGTFGANLADFATVLVSYSEQVSGETFDADAIRNSGTAAKAVVDVLNLIASSGLNGIDTTWGNNFANFGVNLSDFAEQVKAYSTNLSGVNWEAVQNSGTNLRTIFTLLKDLANTEIGSLDNFNAALQSLGSVSLDSFISAFTNPVATDGTSILTAIDTLISSASGELTTEANLLQFSDAGKSCIAEFISGLSSQTELLAAAGADAVSGFLSGIDYNALYSSGTSMGASVLQGFRDETGWHSPWTSLTDAGADAVGGLIGGIEAHSSELSEGGAKFGETFINGLRDEVGWHSWWDLMIQSAEDCVYGFIGTTEQHEDELASAGAKDGKKYANAFQAEIDALAQRFPNLSKAISDNAGRVGKKIDELKNKAQTDSGTGKKVDWKSLFGLEEGEDNPVAKAVDDVTNALNEAGNAAGNAGNAASSAGKSAGKGAKSTKEATKAAKEHENAVKVETKAVEEFVKTYGDVFTSLDDTGVYDIAKDAIHELAMSFVDADTDIEAAMAKMYDTIHTSVEGSFKLFDRFSTSVSISPDAMLKNMRSNFTGISEWAEEVQMLAAKGFSKSLVQDLIKEGPSAQAKVRTFLKMTYGQMMEANDLYAKKSTATVQATVKAITAMAFAGKSQAELIKLANDGTNSMESQAAKSALNAANHLQKVTVIYRELRDTVEQTVESQLDLFTKFDKKTETSAADMLANMQSQISGTQEWANGLSVLAERGIDDGLLAKLSELGPKGYDQVNAFVQMTAEQLEQANQYYQQSLVLPQQVSAQVSTSYLNTGISVAQSMIGGMTQGISESQQQGYTALQQMAQNAATQTRADVANGVIDAKGIGTEVDTQIANGETENTDTTVVPASKQVVEAGASAAATVAETAMESAGYNMVAGLIRAMTSSESIKAVQEAGAQLASYTNGGFTTEEDMNSPSKVWEGFGGYLIAGLTGKLYSDAGLVADAASSLAVNANDAVVAALNDFSSILSGDVNMDPTIRPTLDLTDVESKASLLSSMFDSQAITMAGQVSNVTPYNNQLMAALNNMQQPVNQSVSVGDIYIQSQPGMDEQMLADYVTQQIYTEILSREAVVY